MDRVAPGPIIALQQVQPGVACTRAYNPSRHMALQPGTRLGGYEILGLIGAGGMGEVYRARDPRLGRDVAIKVLPADRVAR